MKFKDWIVFTESIDPQQIINAALAARKNSNCNQTRFEDCKELAQQTLEILKRAGIQVHLSAGTFQTNKESWDHSWLIIMNRWVLDPAVSQFPNIDTKTPGIYYSHPSWDGNKYKDRYYRKKPIAKIAI
jgi:hypothetical protein